MHLDDVVSYYSCVSLKLNLSQQLLIVYLASKISRIYHLKLWLLLTNEIIVLKDEVIDYVWNQKHLKIVAVMIIVDKHWDDCLIINNNVINRKNKCMIRKIKINFRSIITK